MNIYLYLSKEEDPVYLQLSQLQRGEELHINQYSVLLNQFGLYEICGEDNHDCFSTLDKCYEYFHVANERSLLFEKQRK